MHNWEGITSPLPGRQFCAEAGLKGGQVVGKTSSDGMKVEDRPVSVQDLFCTMCHVLALDPMKQNMSNVGRPIRLADPAAKPITEILKSA